MDTALDRSKINRIFDRRHVTARACHQHALRRVGGHPIPSLIHEHPDHTAYFVRRSRSIAANRFRSVPASASRADQASARRCACALLRVYARGDSQA